MSLSTFDKEYIPIDLVEVNKLNRAKHVNLECEMIHFEKGRLFTFMNLIIIASIRWSLLVGK